MMRGIQKVCGHNRGMFLEPYASSFHLTCHQASAKATSNVQNLPRLPVPKLSDTLQKYLKSVRPHLNDEEFDVTATLVKDFEGGVGQKLQGLLTERAKNQVNWLEEWWLNTAYLEYRNPVVVFSNPGLVFPFRKFNNQHEQLRYAARTLIAALDYKALIDCEKIPTEMMGKSPLDMSQYKKIFGTCRIPGKKRDKLSYNDSKYVTVIHNNHIFHLDLWGEDNVRLGEEQIVQQLKKIVELSQTPTDSGIGILTSENRDNWANAYELLTKENVNRESLEDIERSIAVLCLDAPVGLWDHANKDCRQNLAAAQTIHGGGSACNGGNRWFDKTIQLIVGADGVTGLTYEHSPAEGQPIAVMTDFIVNYLDQNETAEKCSSSCVKAPVKLQFVVDSEVATLIKSAQQNLDKMLLGLPRFCSALGMFAEASTDDFYAIMRKKVYSLMSRGRGSNNSILKMIDGRCEGTILKQWATLLRLVEDLELNCFTYERYGKNFIKSQKISPDSYLQMAMQYAFYRLHKTPAAHYESAATRMYVGGRTETIRSCSIESVEFAKTMLDACSSNKDKMKAMVKAITSHKQYTVQALQGFGVDRHLLGLKLTAIEQGIDIPKLYSDPGYIRSTHMRLSTSQVACKCDGFMCYGPLVSNGYATCYNPRNNDVNFATSAFVSDPETSCEKYRTALEQSLQDMHDVLLLNTPSKL